MENNTNEKIQIFISYRREDGLYPAMLLNRELLQNGFSVFFDVNSIRSGQFDKIIYDKIDECTDFILIVTPSTFSSRVHDDNDWIRHEISHALKSAKNIIPLYIGKAQIPASETLPTDIQAVTLYNSLRQQDANLIQEVNKKLIDSFIQAKAQSFSSREYLQRRCSVYDPSKGNEILRLKIQANNIAEHDRAIVLPLLGKRTNNVVLDVGCAYGFVGKSLFTKDNCSLVLGLDKSVKCLDYANAYLKDDCHRYAEIDLESDDVESRLTEILENNGIEKADMIFTALTLHHLKNPLKLLRLLRKYLKTNGVIVIRGSDDGLKICNGTSGVMESIIEKTYNVTGVSDRKNGRKIFGWLKDSGFRNIKLRTKMKDTSTLDFDSKLDLFRESFSYRINYFKRQLENNINDESAKRDFDEMEILLARLEEEFCSDNFWYCEFDIYGFAVK